MPNNAPSAILRPFLRVIQTHIPELLPHTNPSNSSEMEKMMHEKPEQGGVIAFVFEMAKITLIAVAIILPIRYFLIKPFYVNGASMEPNYHNNEYLIIDEITYRFEQPARGDVVVFKYPNDHSQYFIKRVIGLPLERIVVRDNAVFVHNNAYPDGKQLAEPYLETGTPTQIDTDITLSGDEYFVLGDNRTESLDSRRFGPVRANEIIGRSWVRGWPIDRAGFLTHYQFGF